MYTLLLKIIYTNPAVKLLLHSNPFPAPSTDTPTRSILFIKETNIRGSSRCPTCDTVANVPRTHHVLVTSVFIWMPVCGPSSVHTETTKTTFGTITVLRQFLSRSDKKSQEHAPIFILCFGICNSADSFCFETVPHS